MMDAAFAQRIVEVPAKEIRKNVPKVLATVGLAGKYNFRLPKAEEAGAVPRSVCVATVPMVTTLLCSSLMV